MSFASRRELLAKVAPRYREATRKQKTVILNEFISSTGYKRKYAIRLLSLPEIPIARAIKRPRARFYGEAVQEALKIAWCAANCIASKRLSPFLAELVPVLERHGHLELNDEVRHQLISISSATIDRILKPWRSRSGRGTTKRGSLLKHQVPVRTFADWEEKWPGARSDYLFITQKSRGKYDHMSHEGLYGLVKKYGKEAGIPDIYPHMFRHTTGARLARAGLNAFTIQRRLGHSNVVSSQLYVDLAGPDRKAEDGRCEEAIGY